MTTNKKLFLAAMILLTLIFCYFRLKPIYLETIPYTFDQGRDFLKAQEIIREGNITFIGPPSGLQGVFHGVWWYYFLTIPFVIFQGNPLGFILAIFLLSFAQFIFLSVFLKKEFGLLPSLLVAALVSASPYFITTSYFAISSIMNLPYILLFFYFLTTFLKERRSIYLFLIFLSLAFILESEIPLGLFMIPSFLFSIVLLKQWRHFFPTVRSYFYAFLGLVLPTIPRDLFELKNHFPEVKIIAAFITHLQIHNPTTFLERVHDRLVLFYDFYISLFPDKNIGLALITAFIVGAGLIVGYRNFSTVKKNLFQLVFLTFAFLFVLSLFFKDNFWADYYEGLTYFYCLLVAFGIYGFQQHKFKTKWLKFVPTILTGVIIFFIAINLVKDAKATNPNEVKGMKNQITAVNEIYKKAGGSAVCVRIYTPPVIPFTYNYFFSYYSHTKGLKYPSSDFVNKECYFVMEKEQEGPQYQQRIVRWRAANTPTGATQIKKQKISDTVTIELWKAKGQ